MRHVSHRRVLAAPVLPLGFRNEAMHSNVEVSRYNRRIYKTVRNSYVKCLLICQQNQFDFFFF
jgi:hypothetical protein